MPRAYDASRSTMVEITEAKFEQQTEEIRLIRKMKADGHPDAELCAAFHLTAGELKKALTVPGYLQKDEKLRATMQKGHYAFPIHLGDSTRKLRKEDKSSYAPRFVKDLRRKGFPFDWIAKTLQITEEEAVMYAEGVQPLEDRGSCL